VREQDWDVVVLDISLGDRSGLEVLKELKQIRPQLPVLILSMHSEDSLRAGLSRQALPVCNQRQPASGVG